MGHEQTPGRNSIPSPFRGWGDFRDGSWSWLTWKWKWYIFAVIGHQNFGHLGFQTDYLASMCFQFCSFLLSVLPCVYLFWKCVSCSYTEFYIFMFFFSILSIIFMYLKQSRYFNAQNYDTIWTFFFLGKEHPLFFLNIFIFILGFSYFKKMYLDNLFWILLFVTWMPFYIKIHVIVQL